MFRRLRLKLTVLYAGLFCVALLFISATAFAIINANAENMAREELQATGTVFDRGWEFRFQRLSDVASLSARDFGFRQAVATGDIPTIGSALENVRGRLDADVVFIVTPDGRLLGQQGALTLDRREHLHEALETDEAPRGVIMINDMPHQAVSAPIYAPSLLGWVIVAERLDAAEMRALEQLAAIPLDAAVLVQRGNDWISSEAAASADARLQNFVTASLQGEAGPSVLDSADGPAMTLARPFRALDGHASALVLRYPMSRALAPYQGLFGGLALIGFVGVCLLGLGSWMLARSITQPLSDLEHAAQRLQSGAYDPVQVRTRDEISRLAGSFNAMALAIQTRERKIVHLAMHDAEARLPNRLAFERRVEALSAKGPLTVIAIGLDRFAEMRGAIGYAQAGALVRHIGARLQRLAPDCAIARLSSDVLAVAARAGGEEEAQKRARALLSGLERPIRLADQPVDVSVTLGLALSRADDSDPRKVIERASVALDQARAQRVKLSRFDQAAYGDPSLNLSLMGDMRRAIAENTMCVYYQPKLNLRTGKIDAVEALVRWPHARRGMIAPDVFVPMAEETGHVRVLTEWVLQRALADQAALSVAGWPLALSVNVSGRVLADREFARVALAATAHAQHRVCFEITETAIIDKPDLALEHIEAFVNGGIDISIDDYGSGLSSLAYLKQLHAHELKIDKAFIQGITNSRRDAVLVRSTIELGHGLEMKVTAEGVEGQVAYAMLAAMGCDYAQGFFIGRAMPVNELLTLLEDRRHADSLEQARRAAV
jgi:predicted signal transduction protein with EAL and GGDEF domain